MSSVEHRRRLYPGFLLWGHKRSQGWKWEIRIAGMNLCHFPYFFIARYSGDFFFSHHPFILFEFLAWGVHLNPPGYACAEESHGFNAVAVDVCFFSALTPLVGSFDP